MILHPTLSELPSSYADRLGVNYSSLVDAEHKKKLGQFFTPLEVAHFMSSFYLKHQDRIKILDPGSGIGILSCAIIEKISLNNHIKEIELVAFENDNEILNYTDACLNYLSDWLKERNIKFSYFLCKNDFVLHNSSILSNSISFENLYDVIIANPPYFKIRKDDTRTIAANPIIFGQSNIYTVFMMIASKLLKLEGQFIFITPRSFASGNYFSLFRNSFFATMNITNIHVFESRKKAFERDRVLQENIIIVANKKKGCNSPEKLIETPKVGITKSNGIQDLKNLDSKEFEFRDLVNLNSIQKNLHIPISELDEKIIKVFKSWTCVLKTFKMEISTGPVVDFRSKMFISETKKRNSVPLIYLHNIGKMSFIWPNNKNARGKKKGQYISSQPQSLSRLILNKDMVFLRRFSSKDDKSKLIASPYLSAILPKYANLGIENHLNYIYRPNGKMLKDEVYGISALLNSKIFDLYFRTFNGNINVSATELRELPLPDLIVIKEIGKQIRNKIDFDINSIDDIIESIFKIDLKEL